MSPFPFYTHTHTHIHLIAENDLQPNFSKFFTSINGKIFSEKYIS